MVEGSWVGGWGGGSEATSVLNVRLIVTVVSSNDTLTE